MHFVSSHTATQWHDGLQRQRGSTRGACFHATTHVLSSFFLRARAAAARSRACCSASSLAAACCRIFARRCRSASAARSARALRSSSSNSA
jgi:hypothetical protein